MIINCQCQKMSTSLFLLFVFVRLCDPLPFSAKKLSKNVGQVANGSYDASSLATSVQVLQSSLLKLIVEWNLDLEVSSRSNRSTVLSTPLTFRAHTSTETILPMAKIRTGKTKGNLSKRVVSSNGYLLLPSTNKPSPSVVTENPKNTQPTDDTFEMSESKEEENNAALILKLDKYYTPLQIAEYIFSTGDEKGVTQAVRDMLEDGQIMASRDDVILFLERVQEELELLRKHQL